VSTAILIPARMESTRFPGKPLEVLCGRSLLHHCYQHATEATRASTVAVVTDSKEIEEHCLDFDMLCVLDQRRHRDFSEIRTGSDRCACALGHKAFENHDFDTVVNLQSDEPEVSGKDLDALITMSVASGRVTTASCAIQGHELEDPNTIKVVTRAGHFAAYFSRSGLQGASAHVGVYVYPLRELQQFAVAAQPHTEKAEGLEQLRMIHHGTEILVLTLEGRRRSINCPGDIKAW